MEQSTAIEKFETSLIANIWVERNYIVLCLLIGVIVIYINFSLVLFFELLLGMFLWTGIFMLGFVGIAAHIRYYFHFERHRKIELYVNRMVISVNNQLIEQIPKDDILKITLCDKRHIDKGNLFPTYLDPFYYLVVVDKRQETVILTCLLDIRLKKKITSWYGKELEHKYQFFPFPSINDDD